MLVFMNYICLFFTLVLSYNTKSFPPLFNESEYNTIINDMRKINSVLNNLNDIYTFIIHKFIIYNLTCNQKTKLIECYFSFRDIKEIKIVVPKDINCMVLLYEALESFNIDDYDWQKYLKECLNYISDNYRNISNIINEINDPELIGICGSVYYNTSEIMKNGVSTIMYNHDIGYFLHEFVYDSDRLDKFKTVYNNLYSLLNINLKHENYIKLKICDLCGIIDEN
ncbi:hypothetical protein TCON_2179 [Astathelohania contejeani]|uniref:Uncharacterized protein n=1 Tax=Astathelohania contejeani TaxID=164912 RepID=A0ABQ7HWT7_9MICR|nr:hypothetical protein TCON_2179 [Thelohania contejeani]